LFIFLFGFWQWFTQFLAPALGASVTATQSYSPWLLLPVVFAAAGSSLAYVFHQKHSGPALARGGLANRLYVLFLNKCYFDEFYDSYLVKFNFRLAKRLWMHIEVGIIDRLVNILALATVTTGDWLLRFLEGRAINRVVDGSASASVLTARWLWRVLEGRGIQGNVERLARQADAVGRFFQHTEVHTLQEHLLLIIGGLLGILGLFYLLVSGS
jgi:NADH:ubiquinone oxidoreductase subunit 5 (subunit L)/multisubunit Na+/H+ antiporter MnhA subunit